MTALPDFVKDAGSEISEYTAFAHFRTAYHHHGSGCGLGYAVSDFCILGIDEDLQVSIFRAVSYEDIMQSREEYDRFVAELLTASRNGDVTHVTDILDDENAVECGINANSYDNDDTTPLQVAAANGHIAVVSCHCATLDGRCRFGRVDAGC